MHVCALQHIIPYRQHITPYYHNNNELKIDRRYIYLFGVLLHNMTSSR